MEKEHKKKKVLIIGAGLAGLSLATELIKENFEVTIFEKNNHLGGRASNTIDKKTGDSVPIGPHVLLTSYVNMRRFLDLIGSTGLISWQRQRIIELVSGSKHVTLKTTGLPAPVAYIPLLLKNRFLNFFDKLSIVPFCTYTYVAPRNLLEKYDNITALTLLNRWRVTKNAQQNFFSFITLSLNNVPLNKLSGAEMALLFNSWFRVRNQNIGFAKVGLGDVYTTNAKKIILDNGGKIYTNKEVKEVLFNGKEVEHLLVRNGDGVKKVKADIIVSTLTPIDLRRCLGKEVRDKKEWTHLARFEPVPYTSTFLWFDKKITDKKFWAMVDTQEVKHFNTDFYDRSNISSGNNPASFIACNSINNLSDPNHFSDEEIVNKTLKEVKEAFPHSDATVIHSEVHRIPYVIYAPHPGMRKRKLTHRTNYKNFYLAGDWTDDITQCMEAAVRSGYRCAEHIIEDHLHKKKKILKKSFNSRD